MSNKKEKIAIVSRGFWPESPAIGEALLLLSEILVEDKQSLVITQVGKNFLNKLQKEKRGRGVTFSTLPALTDSSSNIVFRILELLLFTGFTFTSLLYHRPDKVYVATNPPIFTPLAVRWYCELFGKDYVYHLQDIHPEITSIVTGKRNVITRLISSIDNKTVKKASTIITLTEQMKSYLTKRASSKLPIKLLNNPSVKAASLTSDDTHDRIKGFVYCGNAGRLQRIPLLIEAIQSYINNGGSLPFVFAGGGVYSSEIEQLAIRFENVTYLGVLPANEASELLRQYSFGLMPIDDEVTKYAFPSKSSSYVFAGCQIVAICGKGTSVAEWVDTNKLGYVAEPNVESLVSLFHELEKDPLPELNVSPDMLEELTPQYHATSLKEILLQVN
ncbi:MULTISPECIES: hypothetical protein [Psychrobacter]|uniref:Glycosyl transferase n=1 Tax=Psychrobacter alimentarius TaxID=261164 RepID=A0ABN4N2B0_9GAMM|nr:MULTISPECIES: hypothetical protein [Psychrobacter]AMT96351.1 glycosyl transferase [Psychrobacter alimentarius]QCB31252.1 glycosyltransferase [Psychrobacter sp. PAMC27889]